MLTRFILAVALLTPLAAQAADSTWVERRNARQQERLQQGVESGSLTNHEGRQLERRDQRHDAAIDRMSADGELTRAERARIRRMENRDSRAIKRQTHDQQTVR